MDNCWDLNNFYSRRDIFIWKIAFDRKGLMPTMQKRQDTKVKTVSLPGERGPEIQYRLTAFNQTNKKKVPKGKKTISATPIAAKNVTTNVVHEITTEETSVEDGNNGQVVRAIPLSKGSEEPKIQNIKHYRIKPLTEFACAHEKDATGSWISGIVYVQDGHIILLDTNNCKLKRFNTMLRFLSSVDVPVDCANLTKISDSEIAVTCLNEIHFYSIGHFGMSRTPKHFDVKGDAYGISYEDDRFAVTCDIEAQGKQAIRILDIFGDEIHVIKPKDDNNEVSIGSYCQLDAKHQSVAVSDFDNRTVYCFNFNGSLKWKCEVDGGPRGLVKIGNDFIVSDNYGQEICAISSESGKKWTILQDEDGVFNPEFIAINNRDLKLAITQRAFDTVTIFSLAKNS